MRRRTITLVVVGLVMALFVLPAAAEIALGDPADAEPVEDQEVPYLSYGYDEDSHTVFFGMADDPEADPPLDCTIPDDVTVLVDPDTGEITFEGEVDGEAFALPEGCRTVNIEGPNGQVNHGQFVSNMVHALKDGYDKEAFGPFGQWVKQFAHDKEIGKGPLKVKAKSDDVEGDLDDEPGDDLGTKDKVKPEKTNKGKSKGKNK